MVLCVTDDLLHLPQVAGQLDHAVDVDLGDRHAENAETFAEEVLDQCATDDGLEGVADRHLFRTVPLLVLVEQEVLAGWGRVSVVAEAVDPVVARAEASGVGV